MDVFGPRDRCAIAAYGLLRRTTLLRRPVGVAAYVAAYDLYKRWTDRDALALMRRVLKPGDTAVDVGAHVGFFAVRLAGIVGRGGLVLAFEPSRWAADILEARFRRAGHPGTQLLRLALSDTVGESYLRVGRFPSDNRLGEPTDGRDGRRAVEPVRTETLDNVLAGLPAVRPALVKIDVQGGEARVLRGMERLLAQKPAPLIMLELWPAGLQSAASSAAEVFRLMARHGLRPGRIAAGGTVASASPDELLRDCQRMGYVDAVFAARGAV